MTSKKSPWGLAAVAYYLYRRATRKVGKPYANPARVWFVRLLLIAVTLPIAAPIFWHALLTMPTPLAVFIGSAVTLRIVRWYLRR